MSSEFDSVELGWADRSHVPVYKIRLRDLRCSLHVCSICGLRIKVNDNGGTVC